MASRTSKADIIKKQTFAQLATVVSGDKVLGFVEDDGQLYYYNAQGGNLGHMGTNWFLEGASNVDQVIFVTPEQNNLLGDSDISIGIPTGGSVPLCPDTVLDGDGSFTIQDGLDLAFTRGGGEVRLVGGIYTAPIENELNMYDNVELVGAGFGSTIISRPGAGLLPTLATPATGPHPISNQGFFNMGGAGTSDVYTLDGAAAPRTLPVGERYIRLTYTLGRSQSDPLVGGYIVYEGQPRKIQEVDTTGLTIVVNALMVRNVAVAPTTMAYAAPGEFMENTACRNFKVKIFADGWNNTAGATDSLFCMRNAVWHKIDNVTYEGDDFGPGASNFWFSGAFGFGNSYGHTIKECVFEKSTSALLYSFDSSAISFIDNDVNFKTGDDGFGSNQPAWFIWMDPGSDDFRYTGNRFTVGVDSDVFAFDLGIYKHIGSGFEKITIEANEWSSAEEVNGTLKPTWGFDISDLASGSIRDNRIQAGGDPDAADTEMTLRIVGFSPALVVDRNTMGPSPGHGTTVTCSFDDSPSFPVTNHLARFNNNKSFAQALSGANLYDIRILTDETTLFLTDNTFKNFFLDSGTSPSYHITGNHSDGPGLTKARIFFDASPSTAIIQYIADAEVTFKDPGGPFGVVLRVAERADLNTENDITFGAASFHDCEFGLSAPGGPFSWVFETNSILDKSKLSGSETYDFKTNSGFHHSIVAGTATITDDGSLLTVNNV